VHRIYAHFHWIPYFGFWEEPHRGEREGDAQLLHGKPGAAKEYAVEVLT